jgi:hypothetical protein
MIRFAIKTPDLFMSLRSIPAVKSLFGFNMAEYSDTLPPAIQEQIFASFYVTDGTSRQTSPDRFRDLDPMTVEFLQERPAGPVHDIGVADGSTSLRLLEAIRDRGLSHPVYISDKFSRITIVKSKIPRIYDSEGRMIAAYLGCLIGEKSPPLFFVNRMLYLLLNKTKQPVDGSTDYISLFAPEVRKSLECGELQELEYDVFRTTATPEFSFIRCMNILNRGYFTEKQIAAAVRNIGASLKIGGILLFGRTVPNGRCDASFFLKTASGYAMVRQVNHGFENTALVVR